MNLFDLHCDTVYECVTKQKDLRRNDLHLDLERGLRYPKWVQTFAFWMPDDLPEEAQFDLYQQERDTFRQFAKKNDCLTPFAGEAEAGRCSYLLGVEGGGLLGGKLERIAELKRDGVTFLTLTWNRENRIGGGAQSTAGLSSFGKKVVREAEQNGILLDVSHLNRRTFWDVCEAAERPLVATHSNADAICPHPRNLTKEQIKELAARGGLIGLNLYHAFLSTEIDCTVTDFLRHIEYFLNAGAGECLAIGTDFDGAALPKWINGIEGIEILGASVVKWFGEAICDQIFYGNAARFFGRIMRQP